MKYKFTRFSSAHAPEDTSGDSWPWLLQRPILGSNLCEGCMRMSPKISVSRNMQLVLFAREVRKQFPVKPIKRLGRRTASELDVCSSRSSQQRVHSARHVSKRPEAMLQLSTPSPKQCCLLGCSANGESLQTNCSATSVSCQVTEFLIICTWNPVGA